MVIKINLRRNFDNAYHVSKCKMYSANVTIIIYAFFFHLESILELNMFDKN